MCYCSCYAIPCLKGRWVALSVDSYLANVPNIIGPCIVLHNICKTHGGHCSDEWMVEEGSHNSGGGTSTTATTPGSSIATVRDTIATARDTIEMNSSSH